MKFLLKEGLHSELNQGLPYEKGSVIETKRDLVRIYGPEKFQRVDDNTKATPNPDKVQEEADLRERVEAAKAAEDQDVDSEEDADVGTLPEGDNVTSTFPDAKVNDLIIVKHGNTYVVYDDLEKKTLESEVKLTSKEKVNAFLDSFKR